MQLGVNGRPFNLSGNVTYTRLPPEAEADVPQWVWYWSRTSAGMYVSFQSNASAIYLNYTLQSANTSQFPNFPPTGFSGCDLYRYDDIIGLYRWVATTFDGLNDAPARGGVVLETPLFAYGAGWPVGALPNSPTMNATYRYRLHLPSYNGITSMSVGVPVGASLGPDTTPPPPAVAKRVLYYGTSITQGGLTARPGQTYISRVSLALQTEVVNMGLCGACQMEAGVGKWLANMTAAPAGTSLVVIDCGWNMNPADIGARVGPLVQQLRAADATVPVLLVEPSDYRPTWILGDSQFNNTGRRIELYNAFMSMLSSGVKGLFYLKGSALYTGDDVNTDPTYEGVHPLDHGHSLIANALTPVIGGIIGVNGFKRVHEGVVLDVRVDGADGSRREVVVAGDYKPGVDADAASTRSGAARTGAVVNITPPLRYDDEDSHSDRSLATAAIAHSQPSSTPAFPSNLTWVDAAASLTIVGRAFDPASLPSPYNRLPTSAKGDVRAVVWSLSLNSAGMMVSFASDTTSVWLNYTSVDDFASMVHFPASGVHGIELFAWNDNSSTYQHVQPAQLSYGTKTYAGCVASGMLQLPPANGDGGTGSRRFLLSLPTYSEPSSVWVGVDAGATILPVDPFPSAGGAAAGRGDGGVVAASAAATTIGDNSTATVSSANGAGASGGIVWYGTSILQGGVSFKTSNIFTSRCVTGCVVGLPLCMPRCTHVDCGPVAAATVANRPIRGRVAALMCTVILG